MIDGAGPHEWDALAEPGPYFGVLPSSSREQAQRVGYDAAPQVITCVEFRQAFLELRTC